jgi:4-alpha-glucanotransferase
MALLHLYWIPAEAAAKDGVYVIYPFEDLLGILALESQRNRCMVIGEDLGTVPEGFRERMAQAKVLSYRVLYFEKDGNHFKRPNEYPDLALACVTTHDLATLAGFWKGSDIELRRNLELYPSLADEQREWRERAQDRKHLLAALAEENLLPHATNEENATQAISPELVAAVHRYLALSPAKLLMVQIDDLTGEEEQLNLPGTIDEYPNWRRRISAPVEDLASAPVTLALERALRERGAPRPAAIRSTG